MRGATVRFGEVPAVDGVNGPDDLISVLGDEAMLAILDSAKPATAVSASESDWPNPEPLGEDLPPVPPFYLKMVPESLRPSIEDVAERMQVPLDFPGATELVALGGSTGRRARTQPKAEDDTWLVTANLWGGIVGPPGFMKSPVLNAVMRPLANTEEMWRSTYASEFESYEEEREKKELQYQAWREKYKQATKKNGDAPLRPDASIPPPVKRRLIVNDATPEKLHDILGDNPAGVLVVRDELTGLLSEMDKEGRESQRSLYLQGWNGYGGHAVDRMGRGEKYVPNVCISLFGLIQPARLRRYLSDVLEHGAGNDGLFQRFQVMVWPDFRTDWKIVDRPPNRTALMMAEKIFSRLANLPTESLRLRFDPEAQEFFNDWWKTLEEKVRAENGMNPALVSHLSKYRSLFPTLAALFQSADLIASDAALPEGEVISINLAHAEMSKAMCAYLEAHALRIYSCIVTPELHAARELAKHIQRGALPDSFNAREVYRKAWASLDTPERVTGALHLLESWAWLGRSKKTTSPVGGRPSETWNINPKIPRR